MQWNVLIRQILEATKEYKNVTKANIGSRVEQEQNTVVLQVPWGTQAYCKQLFSQDLNISQI